jgi:hypothetical protein
LSIVTGNAAGNITYYFYGLGLIGELTDDWNYSLPNGSTPRANWLMQRVKSP